MKLSNPTGLKKVSLHITFWLSAVYGQKLEPILQSTGFENSQLVTVYEKSIAPPHYFIKRGGCAVSLLDCE